MSLPSGYKQLEYIQSSGTQYIDTGYKANQDTRVVMEIDPSDTGVDDWFFDGRNGVQNKSFGVYCQYALAAKPWYSDYGASRLKVAGPSSTGRVTIDKNKNVCAIGGYSVTHPEQTFQSDYNMYLLCLNSAGSKKGYVAGKLYSCRIYNDGVLIRNFVPCKNASNVVGLWDDANSTFYPNAGTGTFTAGPEITSAHETLIDGTGRPINSGRCTIDGTGYAIKKGRLLKDGTGYDILFRNPVFTITVSASQTYRLYAKISKDGTVIFDRNDYGKTFEISEGEAITLTAVTSSVQASNRVIVDGVTVHAADFEGSDSYVFTPSADCTIVFEQPYDRSGYWTITTQ